MSYKKRGQKAWIGKKEAKSFQKTERQYAKSVVDKELDMIHQGEEYREKHKKKARKLTEEEKIKKRIAWYELVIPRWERFVGRYNGYFSDVLHRYKHKLKEMKQKLKDLRDS